MASLVRSTAVFLVVVSVVSALQVTPGSKCASVCLDKSNGDSLDPNASNTKPSDIVCNDVDYWSTSVGVKYRTCLDCLQNSTTADTTESDISWYICQEPSLPDFPRLFSDSLKTTSSTPRTSVSGPTLTRQTRALLHHVLSIRPAVRCRRRWRQDL